jgi:uncharacterized protein YggE
MNDFKNIQDYISYMKGREGGNKTMEQPDTITIEVIESNELLADSVDLFMTIKGKSFFTGEEAFKKAREVHELVNGLKDYGITEEDILLQNVRADISSGIIGKQSSATYRLRIRCRKVDQLADVLGIITSQQNTSLAHMAWRYSDAEEMRAKLLEKCLSKSKEKAEKVAASLSVELLGVHTFDEQVADSELSVIHQPVAANSRGVFKARPMMKEELGLSVSHAKRITLNLTIKYRVSALKATKEGV